ncbi:MAG: C4-dicarboxylate ABC transporter, partial [Craterilacuibacter sp.]
YANQIAKQENEADLKKIATSGKTTVYNPTQAERAAFRKALAPVHAKMAERIGPDLVKSVQTATGFKAQ